MRDIKTRFNQKKLAKNVFNDLCEVIGENGTKYTANKKNLAVTCLMRGEHTLVALDIAVNANDMTVLAISPLLFTVSKERRDVFAVAVSSLNAYLPDGHFDFDYQTGELNFRMILSFANSLIDKQALRYLASTMLKTVDGNNDKLQSVANGNSSVEEIAALLR